MSKFKFIPDQAWDNLYKEVGEETRLQIIVPAGDFSIRCILKDGVAYFSQYEQEYIGKFIPLNRFEDAMAKMKKAGKKPKK